MSVKQGTFLYATSNRLEDAERCFHYRFPGYDLETKHIRKDCLLGGEVVVSVYCATTKQQIHIPIRKGFDEYKQLAAEMQQLFQTFDADVRKHSNTCPHHDTY